MQLGCIVRDTYARDVFLGIRPEYVRLRPAEQGGWRGKVVRVERLGDDTVVEVAVDLGKFVARTAGPPFCGVGDTVGILLPVRHFHVFDSRGERLETV